MVLVEAWAHIVITVDGNAHLEDGTMLLDGLEGKLAANHADEVLRHDKDRLETRKLILLLSLLVNDHLIELIKLLDFESNSIIDDRDNYLTLFPVRLSYLLKLLVVNVFCNLDMLLLVFIIVIMLDVFGIFLANKL